jgi:hypothetical protein
MKRVGQVLKLVIESAQSFKSLLNFDFAVGNSSKKPQGAIWGERGFNYGR